MLADERLAAVASVIGGTVEQAHRGHMVKQITPGGMLAEAALADVWFVD